MPGLASARRGRWRQPALAQHRSTFGAGLRLSPENDWHGRVLCRDLNVDVRGRARPAGFVLAHSTCPVLGISLRRDFDRFLLLRGEVGAHGAGARGGVQRLLRVALEMRHHVAGDQLVAA